jgi:formate-dependent nitrite reductase membrane component NrfD
MNTETKTQSRLLALLDAVVQWLKLGVLDMAGNWRRSADQALEDLQEASRDVDVMEWFWLGVLVLMAMGAWYMMLYATGQQQGLW